MILQTNFGKDTWRRCARGLATLCLLTLLFPSAPAIAQKPLTPEQKKQFGDVIREYLKENPEVVLEALQELDRRRKAAKKAQIANFINLSRLSIFRSKSSPVGGNPDGDVSLVEFFDYNCPYCKHVAPSLFGMLKKDGKTRFVYKEYPILGESSVFAAKAALAVARLHPKLYERFHIDLLAARGRLSETSIFATARKVGVDVDRLKKEMQAPEIEREINQNRAIASHLGISGTPAFIVGTTVMNGAQSPAALQAAVDAVRKERKASKEKNRKAPKNGK